MAEYTIHISDTSKKTKYLLGLIKELAKTEKTISIEENYEPNEVTLQAIEDVEHGKTYKSKNVDDLFNNLQK